MIAPHHLARELACGLVIIAVVCGTSFAATKGNAKAPARGKEARESKSPTKSPTNPEDPREAQARQTAERARLVERIASLKKQIAAGEKSRAGSAAALARAERSLADIDQRLEQLALRQRGVQQRIVDLDRKRTGKQGEVVKWEGDLAHTATALAANRDQDPFKLFLTGRDPNSVMLNEAYLGYLARAELAQVRALRGHVSELQDQRQHAVAENRVLVEEAAAQKSARESLVVDRSAQRDALSKLSQKLAEQRRSANALEADEKRLSRVVEQLQREIARRAAQERKDREAARRRAEELATAEAAARKKNRAARDAGGATARPQEQATLHARVDAVPEAANGGAEFANQFAQQRGRLRLPARGTLVARFGAPRGDGGASWKGLFIKTESGAEVRAVAAGRVVFADYLRGFGNLLIVDHGDQYLSIYGNNETLVKHAGDAVKVGDVVSLSGNSSGDDQTGLYFELRFRGKPFDPMGWVGAR